MARDLHIPTTYSCPTWDTADLPQGNRVNGTGAINDMSGNDIYREHLSTVAVPMISEGAGHTSVDLTKMATICHLDHQIGLPKQNKPAFAPGVPLAAMLLWKHKGFKHLC